MQQKRGESQKDQCNFGVQGQWGVGGWSEGILKLAGEGQGQGTQ